MALFESLGTVSYSSYIPFGKEKLEWSGYPMVKKRLRICVSVLTEYRRVTDRRTNGQPGQCLRLLVSLAGSVYLLKACA